FFTLTGHASAWLWAWSSEIKQPYSVSRPTIRFIGSQLRTKTSARQPGKEEVRRKNEEVIIFPLGQGRGVAMEGIRTILGWSNRSLESVSLALVLRLFLLICARSGVRRGRACGFGYVGGGDVVFSGLRVLVMHDGVGFRRMMRLRGRWWTRPFCFFHLGF